MKLTKIYHRDIVHGDCLEVLKNHPDNFFDSVVCDPPYGLEFMGKGWDKLADVKRANRGTQPSRKRPPGESGNSPKFNLPAPAFDLSVEANRAMQEWHFAWATEVFRVLKPGGHLLAFGGTRTSHRLACAIEDAGFKIRDSIIWIYGSGFPKSLDIGKAIDKAAGVKREVVGIGKGRGGGNLNRLARPGKGDSVDARGSGAFGMGAEQVVIDIPITTPATPEAQQWDGWGTALKPAHEPIIVGRKPLSESTVAANVLKHGTGGINIDGSRIGLNGDYKSKPNGRPSQTGLGDNYDPAEANQPDTVGRWPANLIFQHHDDCVQAGTKKVKASGNWTGSQVDSAAYFGQLRGDRDDPGIKVKGKEEVEAWDCHPDCPVRLLDEQSGVTTSGAMKREVSGYAGDGMFMQGRSGPRNQRADTGGASRFFYQAKASPKERFFICRTCDTVDNDRKAHKTPGWNAKTDGPDPHVQSIIFHPTQKPVELIRYLVRLVTPEGGYVLDPFIGSGTLGVAAKAEGFNYLGIDQDPDYCRIARYRGRLK